MPFSFMYRTLNTFAAAAALAAAASACAEPSTQHHVSSSTSASTTFYQAGFLAGPVLFTDAQGVLIEERRHEPFGTPIEIPNIVARDLNSLGKRTEPRTGWSDHGARWMAPQIARWLTTDPPVAGPNADLMLQPWALHPYQYVQQNPTTYWDPKGTCSAPILPNGAIGICIEAFIAAPHVGPFSMGEGDNRGFAANDSSKTSRIQQQITIAAPGDMKVATVTGNSCTSFGLCRQGASETNVRDAIRVTDTKTGDWALAFTAGGHAVNGFSGLPLAPKGSIDYAFRFNVDSHGRVSLVGGTQKNFPSYAVYAYTRDVAGKIVTHTLHESPERNVVDLTGPFHGLKDRPHEGPGVEKRLMPLPELILPTFGN